MELHPMKKNILLDILSKENAYELFSERVLARKSKISRYAAKKYTRNLEKKEVNYHQTPGKAIPSKIA
jgi:predicted transcriptional regulator